MTERSNIDPERRVQWVYSSTSNDELASRYDEWAQDYDDDLTNTFVWLSPRLGAVTLAEHVSASGRILDAGAGTGLVGVELQRLGYRDICALDLSEGYAARGACQRLLRRVSSDGAWRASGFRFGHVRRRNQHRCIHARSRARQRIRRAMPNHETRRLRRRQPEAGYEGRTGLRGVAERADDSPRVELGVRERTVPRLSRRASLMCSTRFGCIA